MKKNLNTNTLVLILLCLACVQGVLTSGQAEAINTVQIEKPQTQAITEAEVKWAANGTPICTESGNQDAPQIISDGQGGFIIVWEHWSGINDDIYAQRIDSLGVAQWTANGTNICNATGNQGDPKLISDGQGGAIITWVDARGADNDVYAQYINSSGKAQWTPNGTLVCNAPGNQGNLKIVSDGRNGTIITWQDWREANGDIYVQRVNSSGATKWAVNGTLVCNETGTQSEIQVIIDGQNGTIITWTDRRLGSSNTGVFAQRVNSTGGIEWAANGTAISTDNNNQWDPQLLSDGNGGAIITWEDERYGSGNADIYAQRINSSGATQWNVNGTVVGNATGAQRDPKIISDGQNGYIIAWEDERDGSNEDDIYLQRINSAGTPQWAPNGTLISNEADEQFDIQVVSDGDGGAIISWVDERDGDTEDDIYAQRVDSNGNILWDANGTAVCIADRYVDDDHQSVSDGQGGVIIVWADYRDNTYNVYAQRIVTIDVDTGNGGGDNGGNDDTPPAGIPGYNMLIFIGLLGIFVIVLIKKHSK